MLKKIPVSIALISCIIVPGFTQDNAKKAAEKEIEKIDDKVYFETILEDFESTQYSKKNNIKYRTTRYQKGDISIRDVYPAPTGKSKKYLGVKVFAKKGDVFKIIPAKKLVINKYCKSIALWVYGKRFSGELSILIQDAIGQNHRIILGNTEFLGWRKLIIKLSKKIKQEDEYLNQKRYIKILQIQYRPGNMTRLPLWQYFYLDDISAMVREKYTDRQSDDW